mgnify:CR=1 FL=1
MRPCQDLNLGPLAKMSNAVLTALTSQNHQTLHNIIREQSTITYISQQIYTPLETLSSVAILLKVKSGLTRLNSL